MRIVEPSFQVLQPFNREAGLRMLRLIERAGRTCYKSEDLISDKSALGFVERITKSGHESVIEHGVIVARVVTDRGVTHELVRHRLCSYSQESTRYCGYDKGKFGSELAVIQPPRLDTEEKLMAWRFSVREAEKWYMDLRGQGCPPEIARSVLPNCLKTEIVVTANVREWRHIMRIRVENKRAHPQIRYVLGLGLKQFKEVLPEIFGDIGLPEDLPEWKT